tara:strand:- start:800 stop:1123 length:324 start_codon:yes stop_codon:yes gene_type:complete
MNKENRIKLADQISFRLLATRKHEDHSWLVNILKAKKEKTTGSIKRFFKFFLIWYSQQMAIPFWIIGHVHLHFSTWHDLYEYGLSIFLHLMVGVGFWIDWKESNKKK